MKELPGDGARLHNYEAFIAVVEAGEPDPCGEAPPPLAPVGQPLDVRTPARVRRFVDLLAGRLRKEIV